MSVTNKNRVLRIELWPYKRDDKGEINGKLCERPISLILGSCMRNVLSLLCFSMCRSRVRVRHFNGCFTQICLCADADTGR